MPSILNLKFKGNKSFVAFSNLNDTESLTKTWKVCTKVASYLEQGQRLENLSWRLWHLQNLMVDTDNARSKREFKKLSKCMGDKLDKEKGRSIEELEAPDFKRNHSTDMIRQRAVEKERSREASQNAQPGTIKRMQFTFSVDQPAQSLSTAPVKKPDTKPSSEFSKRARAPKVTQEDTVMADGDAPATTATAPATSTSTSTTTTTTTATNTTASSSTASLHFPGLFNNNFGPSALLYATPTVTNRMNYGEGFNPSGNTDQFSISRPTIELALDDLLFNDDSSNESNHDGDATHTVSDWSSQIAEAISSTTAENKSAPAAHTDGAAEKVDAPAPAQSTNAGPQQDVVMGTYNAPVTSSAPSTSAPVATSPVPVTTSAPTVPSLSTLSYLTKVPMRTFNIPTEEELVAAAAVSEDEDIDQLSPAPSTARKLSAFRHLPPVSQTVKDILPETVSPSRINSIYGTRSSTPTGRPTLTLRTQTVTRSANPGATATSLNPALLRGGPGSTLGNSAPGGLKAECSNCGATHTPLWRRGLNDELNCNACGLYCKLHKRPRPKSMRNSHGESRASATPRQEAVDVMAQCYNCHTTATPLWRKDDEGKTVCNACGLYYKLHGSARPISMKSDVIRKRSRHDARRSGNGTEDTPSASPGVSRRTSPVRDGSPTLAPDSTTQMTYEYTDDGEYRNTTSSSELLGALGGSTDSAQAPNYGGPNPFQLAYPGPYHPDYLMTLYGNIASDALPFHNNDSPADAELTLSPRSTKRRRMSTDSTSEPPSSAVSFGSYSGDSFSSTSSASTSHSKRASMEFPFSTYNSNGTINQGPALRGSGNTFWHPPMMPQSNTDNEPGLFNSGTSSEANSSSSSTSASSSAGANASGSASSASGSNSTSSSSSSVSSSSGAADEDSPMDYLHHPPMALQDEESLFSTYLHPPMALSEESNKGSPESSASSSSGIGSGMFESYFQ
ncbi:GATA-binding factor 1-A [Psilocybe cubensis]|uniref:GATA-binding factor 1-A n=2 Tax=Psilocybe cubensis TaxID=181762 RepID=A0ACB8GMM2_PSICU|nr:GATA-binding factor 1-A [Psilocybe cubensis]KAH9476806.1 GATA-binding factor 1-A [Psilocybe cubensis]